MDTRLAFLFKSYRGVTWHPTGISFQVLSWRCLSSRMVSSDYSFKHPSGISLQVLPWCHLTSDRHFFLYILLILIFILCTNYASTCHVLNNCQHAFSISPSWAFSYNLVFMIIYSLLHLLYHLFTMFASTFKHTHWLVPGYLLGQVRISMGSTTAMSVRSLG